MIRSKSKKAYSLIYPSVLLFFVNDKVPQDIGTDVLFSEANRRMGEKC